MLNGFIFFCNTCLQCSTHVLSQAKQLDLPASEWEAGKWGGDSWVTDLLPGILIGMHSRVVMSSGT